MGIEGATDWRAEAASALNWWRDAGVDVLVEDDPRDWTARPAPTAQPDAPMRTVPVGPEPEAPLPATIEAFLDWRYGAGAPEAAMGEPIVAAEGNADATLMVVTDLPEFDGGTPALLDGSTGRLFDRILAAIGQSRESIYLAPLCAARPITGQVPRDLEDKLGDLLRHHIALAAPARLLLLGQATSRAVLGTDAARNAEGLTPLNYSGGKCDVVAIRHPRFLLNKPAAKGDAWKDLQLLIGGQSL
ncbi:MULTISPECIES: uracil-DNA glycosylase family protein [unclassified Sphingomonas]|uniref:uracil-DNA glycosylase family protein n=1 Tax=unclassified Sphingomonas TaxID=196159 RepID=UPI000830B149|nr:MULTISPECIES: uracil-DNA glycosylase family protein [unclassified Sphingomonas]